MKTFSNYKKIALIFVIIAIFACTVICTVKITGSYILKHTEIYNTPIIQ